MAGASAPGTVQRRATAQFGDRPPGGDPPPVCGTIDPMSPFGFGKRDRLKQPELKDPVSAQALVVRGDPGYSAMSWWSASIRLQVAVPGLAPTIIEHQCNAVREKTPLAGSVLPVEVERDDQTQVRILWAAVPTIEQRIADRDSLIFDPEGAWRVVLEADPTRSDQKPSWGNGALPGWPPSDVLPHGRKAGTALVIADSWDPGGNVSGGFAAARRALQLRRHDRDGSAYLPGLAAACVNPYDGGRYGLQLETKIRRDRFGPVLPVAIDPERPGDIEIEWDSAPAAPPPPSAGTQLADAIVHGGQVIAPDSAAAAEVFSQVENPNVSPLGNRLLRRMSAKGAMIVVSSSAQTDAPAGRPAALAQLQELRDPASSPRRVRSRGRQAAAVVGHHPADPLSFFRTGTRRGCFGS